MEHYEATAIILAGGQSKRMGKDKALLEYQGKTFIEHLVYLLKPRFNEVLISAKDAETYANFGAPVVPDKEEGGGPLIGLAAALEASGNELNFVIACDSPVIIFQVVTRLLKSVEGHDCAVLMGENNQLEPLFGVYRKSLLPRILEQLKGEDKSVYALLSQCQTNTVSVRKGTLANINTPEEYEAFKLYGTGGR